MDFIAENVLLLKINLDIRKIMLIFVMRKNKTNMILEKGIKIYNSVLEKCVNYVNNGWGTEYKVEDVVGFELGETFIFVHFCADDYAKYAYPIKIETIFK